MKSIAKARQAGFTLVEIAIVLVIIGLLLGGVLKGQELIDSSRAKNAVNDLNGVITAYNGYFDRFRRFPGDDGPIATLTARGSTWATLVNQDAGNANGVLAATAANTFTGGGEGGRPFWNQLRAAGFLSGAIANNAAGSMPQNAFGGLIGITTDVAAGTLALPGPKVCMSRVPGKAARQIDTQLDDGASNAGTVRATTGAAGANTVPGAAAAAYIDTAEYTICRTM